MFGISWGQLCYSWKYKRFSKIDLKIDTSSHFILYSIYIIGVKDLMWSGCGLVVKVKNVISLDVKKYINKSFCLVG